MELKLRQDTIAKDLGIPAENLGIDTGKSEVTKMSEEIRNE